MGHLALGYIEPPLLHVHSKEQRWSQGVRGNDGARLTPNRTTNHLEWDVCVIQLRAEQQSKRKSDRLRQQEPKARVVARRPNPECSVLALRSLPHLGER